MVVFVSTPGKESLSDIDILARFRCEQVESTVTFGSATMARESALHFPLLALRRRCAYSG